MSITGWFGATLSNAGIGYSVANSSPLSFATSISTALVAPLFSANMLTRMPLAM